MASSTLQMRLRLLEKCNDTGLNTSSVAEQLKLSFWCCMTFFLIQARASYRMAGLIFLSFLVEDTNKFLKAFCFCFFPESKIAAFSRSLPQFSPTKKEAQTKAEKMKKSSSNFLQSIPHFVFSESRTPGRGIFTRDTSDDFRK